MKKYHTIAVGTDGSESAMEAVKTAASLAGLYQAELVVICAHYSNTGSLLGARQSDISSIAVISEDDAQEHLAAAREVAQAEGAKAISLHLAEGSPADVLVRTLAEVGADLVVVGNKGVNTLSGRVFGSIPTEVSRKAHIDVMLVNTSGGR
ncbi:Universal stress protein [Corynebacterium occultum]|uniref:Universal stress protein n=1 Tax=Corynebacterium occultum TaxID=2675219 RepID=A0A6B8W3Z5_9CORY|nr:universal stress protein [Corynebacterium occultum]QGU07241.1 Universal stress protein [Corynebacterium occultum]